MTARDEAAELLSPAMLQRLEAAGLRVVRERCVTCRCCNEPTVTACRGCGQTISSRWKTRPQLFCTDDCYRRNANKHSTIDVACPSCNAEPGAPCVSVGTVFIKGQVLKTLHVTRRRPTPPSEGEP